MASRGPPWARPSSGQGDFGDVWEAWGHHQLPPLPPIPWACTAPPCCGLLPAPPLSLLAQQVSAPCERPGPALYWSLAPSGGPGAKVAASASRESTAALKAWLGRHRRNPYPTKGEKVLLALLSRMSLTQVSTWFANARRRLKKELRAAPAPRSPPGAAPPPPAQQEGEEEEEELGEPPRRKAKIWCLAELAAARDPQDGTATAAGLQH